MRLKEIWISFEWISAGIHSFCIKADIDNCYDFDDLKTVLMDKLDQHNLQKYGILINGNLVGENEELNDLLKNNGQENPVIFVRISKSKDYLNVNEDEEFFEEKNENYLWCSIDGYIPTKIHTKNCQKLLDLKSKLLKKFRKCDYLYKDCWENGKELSIELTLDQIKYNSFHNSIVFSKKNSKSLLQRIGDFFKF